MEIIRLWKDLDYREGLTDEELAGAPTHPAGVATLSGTDLDRIDGAGTAAVLTRGCCNPWDTWTTTSPILCTITTTIC